MSLDPHTRFVLTMALQALKATQSLSHVSGCPMVLNAKSSCDLRCVRVAASIVLIEQMGVSS